MLSKRIEPGPLRSNSLVPRPARPRIADRGRDLIAHVEHLLRAHVHRAVLRFILLSSLVTPTTGSDSG